ncbi:MAG: anti-sigma factor [Panacagrimonas sp.]
MKYNDAELMRQLGAEYAMGTLRGRARRRFERLMSTHPEARAQVDFWDQRLSEFGQVLRPVTPPTAARAELLRRAAAPILPKGTTLRVKTARRRRGRGWAWPYAAGLATAASLVLAFVLGQRNPDIALPASDSVLAHTAPAGEGLPIYAAQLRMPASSMQWLVSVSSDHRKFIVLAADDFLQVGRHSLQLWGVSPGAEPIALGVLPSERDGTSSFDIPASMRGQPEVRFVISLEPAGGPLLGKPSGAVMNEAEAALDGI